MLAHCVENLLRFSSNSRSEAATVCLAVVITNQSLKTQPRMDTIRNRHHPKWKPSRKMHLKELRHKKKIGQQQEKFFGIASFRGGVLSDGVFSGTCPFGMVFIRDRVISGSCLSRSCYTGSSIKSSFEELSKSQGNVQAWLLCFALSLKYSVAKQDTCRYERNNQLCLNKALGH